jgi:solute carrier family 25 thiamine pyrophosphate transporter 19
VNSKANSDAAVRATHHPEHALDLHPPVPGVAQHGAPTHHSFHAAVAGGTAGLVSRFAVAPLDVIKIRRQVSPHRVKDSLYSALAHVYRQEGLWGLYRGNTWAMMLWVVYGAVQFPVYDAARAALGTDDAATLASGAAAAMAATTASFPLDVVRTRVLAMGHPRVHATTLGMLSAALQHGSLQSVMFKGLASSLVVVAPTMALIFDLHQRFERMGAGSGVAGALAGTAAKAVTYPLDVVKHRLQSQGLERVAVMGNVPPYTSFAQCLASVYRQEGAGGLMKGMAPAVLKTGVATGLTFLTFDLCLKMMEDRF